MSTVLGKFAANRGCGWGPARLQWDGNPALGRVCVRWSCADSRRWNPTEDLHARGVISTVQYCHAKVQWCNVPYMVLYHSRTVLFVPVLYCTFNAGKFFDYLYSNVRTRGLITQHTVLYCEQLLFSVNYASPPADGGVEGDICVGVTEQYCTNSTVQYGWG